MSTSLKSSVIDALGYDERAQTLEIRFVRGKLYRYSGVPRQIVGKLLTADSVGTFFARHIRNAFPCEELAA